MAQVDIVYVLGSGSTWQNWELRYSLRSVAQYCPKIRRVYVVGEDPGFLSDAVTLLAMKDSGSNKALNIRNKIIAACSFADLSKRFLFFNDDFFLLQPVDDPPSFPNYTNRCLGHHLAKRRPGDLYRANLLNTIHQLVDCKLPVRHFDGHAPIIYDKDLFPDVMKRFDWSVRGGMVIKSLYGNALNLPAEEMDDCKIDYPLPMQELEERLRPRPFFSIGDRGITQEMKTLLQRLYPNRCRYERP